ncbi:MAG TPA: hypothetical protein PLA90_13455, partial [Candidatus Sumerlaeota bacterium]|nr:hypothetical protein [Candidatus Sumerlaeota bacterium]
RTGGQCFSFEIPVDAEHPMALVVTYSSDERQPKAFEIQVEGQRVGEQTVDRRTPEQEPKFFDVEYKIPGELLKDKQKVTVRFQAAADKQIGTVCGIRMIRADAER